MVQRWCLTPWAALWALTALPWFIVLAIKRGAGSQGKAQGLGRHSPEEQQRVGRAALDALRDFLGTNILPS